MAAVIPTQATHADLAVAVLTRELGGTRMRDLAEELERTHRPNRARLTIRWRPDRPRPRTARRLVRLVRTAVDVPPRPHGRVGAAPARLRAPRMDLCPLATPRAGGPCQARGVYCPRTPRAYTQKPPRPSNDEGSGLAQQHTARIAAGPYRKDTDDPR